MLNDVKTVNYITHMQQLSLTNGFFCTTVLHFKLELKIAPKMITLDSACLITCRSFLAVKKQLLTC